MANIYYPGNTSYATSEYSPVFTNYKINAGRLGATTSIQTSNQVREVTNLLNQGLANVEVSVINPDVFEMIPKDHLKEIYRISKLTGSETSLHAPIIDPSGFTQQGWEETNRKGVEKQFSDVIERAHDLNPKGNVPVTIHASQIPGSEHIEIIDPETGKKREVYQKMIAVNRENGQLTPLEREKRFYPGAGEKFGKEYIPEEELKIANAGYWDNKLSQLVFYKERGDEIMTKFAPLIRGELNNLTEPEQKQAALYIENAHVYFKNTHQSLNGLFNEAYKFSDEEGKKLLKEASEQFAKDLKKAYDSREPAAQFSFQSGALQGLINNMQKITDEHTPQIYMPVEKFVQEKASQTLGAAAWHGYDKFKETAPIVSVENPPYGSAISRAQDLKDLIQQSKQVFVEKAMKDGGLSKEQAQQAADKVIGATWDTSHISMIRKQGFGSEKLVEEAKIIAPFVKHVHLNDNFGSTHTDLPPGMGTVPIKEIMEQLKKAGFEGKNVFEGGNFFQNFQTSPHPYVLEGFGSPLYSSGVGPDWNRVMSTYGNYFAGYGSTLPDQHFSLYGAGFSGLPTELGGQVPGRGSRATGGTPLA